MHSQMLETHKETIIWKKKVLITTIDGANAPSVLPTTPLSGSPPLMVWLRQGIIKIIIIYFS